MRKVSKKGDAKGIWGSRSGILKGRGPGKKKGKKGSTLEMNRLERICSREKQWGSRWKLTQTNQQKKILTRKVS